MPPSGPTLLRAFQALIQTLNERRVDYAIIGGLAVIHHGRIRTTEDIDVLLALPQIAMAGFFEALQRRGFEVDVAIAIRDFLDAGAAIARFEHVIVDLVRPVLPMYGRAITSSVESMLAGVTVRVCAPEGLIAMKVIADRPQDQMDVRELMLAYGGRLDFEFIRREIRSVVGADDPRCERFEQFVRDVLS